MYMKLTLLQFLYRLMNKLIQTMNEMKCGDFIVWIFEKSLNPQKIYKTSKKIFLGYQSVWFKSYEN